MAIIDTLGKNNGLSKDNNQTYEPTEDYNPATKKYVDDLIRTFKRSGLEIYFEW